jgi:hypothetical protein
VTSRREAKTAAPLLLDTKELGEAMASAPESLSSGGKRSGAGAAPVFSDFGLRTSDFGRIVLFAFALVACGGNAEPIATPPVAVAQGSGAADPSAGVTTELDGTAPLLDEGVLAELLGDATAARAAFERVLAAAAPPRVTAHAALHLAQLEARAGRRRRAADLAVRAQALAPSDPAIAEGVRQLELEDSSTTTDVRGAFGEPLGDIRGPRLGTALPDVPADVATAFAAAERALARVHQQRARIVFEALSSSIRAREDAFEDCVAKYRAIADRGGIAEIAADYRIGTLYHDLAFELVLLELPSELDPAFAASVHRTLRGRATEYLKRAAAAYRGALAVAIAKAAARQNDAAESWRQSARADLRTALDVLGEAGAK